MKNQLPENHINQYLLNHGEWLGGIRGVYRFENGYGASVVAGGATTRFRGDYYIELAVLKFGEGDSFDLCYDTPLTDDVMIMKSEESLIETLWEIQKLEK